MKKESLNKQVQLILKTAKEKEIEYQLLNNERTDYILLKKNGKCKWISPKKAFFNPRVSYELAANKYLTQQILKSVNLPMPQLIKLNQSRELDQLIIPCPWVIKPLTRTRGKDVLIGIKEINELKKYSAQLLKKYPYLLIEEFIPGQDFRLLVLKDRMLAAIKRIPPKIKADGIHTIKQLIELDNQKQRRRTNHLNKSFLKPLVIDLETKRCLNQQGFRLNSIPEKDQIIQVRQNANFSTGAELEDVTETVHPENKKIAIKATKALGLEIAGVDIITKDISQPIIKNKGKISEVNSIPSLWIHHYPHHGKSRNVAGMIIDYLFL